MAWFFGGSFLGFPTVIPILFTPEYPPPPIRGTSAWWDNFVSQAVVPEVRRNGRIISEFLDHLYQNLVRSYGHTYVFVWTVGNAMKTVVINWCVSVKRIRILVWPHRWPKVVARFGRSAQGKRWVLVPSRRERPYLPQTLLTSGKKQDGGRIHLRWSLRWVKRFVLH